MLEFASTALPLTDLTTSAVLEILLLAVGYYWLLLLIRGTRAAQATGGLAAVAILHFITGPGLLDLGTIHSVLGYLLLYLPFAIIVIFQNPMRQALARLSPVGGWFRKRDPDRMVEEVALAATSLASKRIGGLIVIERRLGLRAFYETGLALDALASYDLLLNIFTPSSPLHDGAAIIAEGRIKAASCYLPLTTDPDLSLTYGTRHRAAIGITQETDALAVVVSEERGVVSLAEAGRIVEDLGAEELAGRLRAALAPGQDDGGSSGAPETATADSTHA